MAQSLNGEWRFHYSVNAMERPADFFEEDYSEEGFGDIKVPCHIELAGYNKIHYINTMYPWEGHMFRRLARALHKEDGADGSFKPGRLLYQAL